MMSAALGLVGLVALPAAALPSGFEEVAYPLPEIEESRSCYLASGDNAGLGSSATVTKRGRGYHIRFAATQSDTGKGKGPVSITLPARWIGSDVIVLDHDLYDPTDPAGSPYRRWQIGDDNPHARADLTCMSSSSGGDAASGGWIADHAAHFDVRPRDFQRSVPLHYGWGEL